MEKDFSFLHYLKAVSSDDQAYEGLDPDQLWLFYISETDVLGPFRQSDIIKYIPQFRHEFAPLKTCSVSKKEWKPFFDHSCFNVRDHTRELHTKTKFRKIELIADKYLCLVNGIKKGPFTQSQIIELIQNKEIRADALISADLGMTWHRGYTFPQFNRRTKQSVPEHHITMPEEALEKTKLIVLDKIKKASGAQDSGALSAALLSGKNRHLAREKLNNVISEKIQKVTSFSLKNQGNGKKTNPIFALVLVAALIFLVFVDSGSDNNSRAKKDPLEILQSKKSKRTSAKYEDESPPQALRSNEVAPEEITPNRVRRNKDYDQSQDDIVYEEEESHPDYNEEEFDQEPNEYDDSSKKNKARSVSSTKKKAVKKVSVSHQEDEPTDSYEGYEEESYPAEESEDFELDE